MKIFFIDQQSYHNLSIYDYNILSRLNLPIHYFCSELYDYKTLPENILFSKVFKYSSKKGRIAKVLSYIFSMMKILLGGVKERPEIYHFQWMRVFTLDYYVPYILKKIFDTKVIFTVHNILPRKQKKNTVKHFTKIYELSDYLIVHTETTKKELIERFGVNPEKIIIMPHGLLEINVDELEYKKCINRYINDFDVKNKLLIALLGAQSYYKGTDLLVNAWKHSDTLSKNENIVLLIAGKNNMKEKLDDLPNNVKVINRILSNEEFKALIHISDLIALPYREIDQSGFLLSILNENAPYCCTNVGELIAPLKIADVGWNLGKPEEKTIGKNLELIVSNPAEIYSKKKNLEGWKKIHSLFGWDTSALVLKSLYQKIVSQ